MKTASFMKEKVVNVHWLHRRKIQRWVSQVGDASSGRGCMVLQDWAAAGSDGALDAVLQTNPEKNTYYYYQKRKERAQYNQSTTYMRFVSFTAMFLGNVIVGIWHFFPPSLSYRQQRVHRASCVGFHQTEGRRALGTRQVLALERQSCPKNMKL